MVLLLASLFAAGCGTSVPPSDGEMIRLFRTHEAAFNQVYEIISEKTEGSHYYPPSEFDSIFIRELAAAEGLSCGLQGLYGEDSSYLHGLFPPDRALLDSLLAVTGCELVRFYRRECGEDSVELSLTMVHYSHGLSVSGTAKCFVCDPGLRNCPWVRIAEQGDLNESTAGRSAISRYTNRSREIGTLSWIMRTDDGNKRKMELLSARMFRLCLCDSGLNLSPSAMQIRTVRCRALAYFAFHELNKGGPVGPPFLLSGMKSFLTSPRLVSAPHAPLQDAR